MPVPSGLASRTYSKDAAMRFDRILFPTDFSHTGDAALAMATSLARDSEATLYIVHVQEPPAFYGGGEMYYGMLDPTTDELVKMLEEVKPNDPSVHYEQRLLTGEPAQAIVDFATSEHIDLIVLGTHGRGGLSRLLMGSVAEAVVRRAQCPVLTFKHAQVPAVAK
jgi:nucleotide-binding universal stress UspA family protein